MSGIFGYLVAGALVSQGFVPVAERHGVQVYRREGGGGMELAAEGIIAAPPEAVQRVLLDYAHHPRWVKALAESRVLASGPDSLDVYQRLDLPFIEDRDFTLHVTFGAEGQRRWLRFVTANQRGPAPRRGVVRVTLHEGEWSLAPTEDGLGTRATYRFHLDLAGSLPSWLGKGKAAKDLTEMFENVGKEARGGS